MGRGVPTIYPDWALDHIRKSLRLEGRNVVWAIDPVGTDKKAGDIAGYLTKTSRTTYRMVGVTAKHPVTGDEMTCRFMAHRAAWFLSKGVWPVDILDHRDGDGENNDPENLRLATRQTNPMNVKPARNNKSGVRGVSFHARTGRWRARISAQKREVHLGLFDTFEDAVRARYAGELQYHGEFAAVLGAAANA